MDKDLVNNQIVLMRKIVRNSKRFVYQKLVKRLKKLEIKSNEKLQNKITNKRKELMATKGANVDDVSKQALVHNKTYFENVIKSNQSSVEDKCLARIAINDSIEKAVKKFKDENPNCDQWIPSQIELWNQKKIIKRDRFMKKKTIVAQEDNCGTNAKTIDLNSKQKALDLTKNDLNLRKVKQKTKIVETNDKKNNPKINQKLETKDQELKQTSDRKSDPFFLSNDLYANEEQSEDSIDSNDRQMNENKYTNKRRNNSDINTDQNFTKSLERKSNQRINKNVLKNKLKSFENNDKNQRMKDKTKSTSSPTKGEGLHPSWAAKRSVKERFKIDFNDKPMAKKITFNNV